MRWCRQWDKKGQAELGLLGDGVALRKERGGGGYSLERGAADLFRVKVLVDESCLLFLTNQIRV